MASGKDKPSSLLDYRRLVVLLLLSFLVSLVISIKNPFFLSEYEVGDIARTNIRAPSDINIPGRDMAIKKGEIIVREGERISAAHMDRLLVLKELRGAKTPAVKGFFLVFLLLFISVTIIYEYADRNIKKFSLASKDLLFASVLILFTTALVKLTTLISEAFISHITVDLFYVMPIFLFGIIIRIVLFSEAAMVFSLVLAIAMGFAFRNSTEILLYTFLGNLLAAYFSGKCENRNTILKAGLYTAFVMSFVLLLFSAFFEQSFEHLPLKVAFILINGVGSSFIALGLLPVIEHIFDYTTDVKLLELANFEHPLLEEMMVNAPGTYHHSIIVGNLSKAAAESIGAHPILTRVSAYYHDIGKLKMPHYFIENSTGFDDVHQSLSPNMSSLIILSHTKEGVEFAHKYKLGTKIEEIITQHHGTSLVTYFFNRAKEMEDPKLHVTEEKDFRYGGPKPQTKEAGIVMLADAVEAASRILNDPTPKRIETHVQNIIENIFLDGQLDDCELTLKDLHAIQRSFIAVMLGIFHHRIEYPERIAHDGTAKRLPKNGKDGQKESPKDHRRLTHLFGSAR